MKTIIYNLAVLIILIFASRSYSQVTQQWAARYNGPANSTEEVFDMEADSSGNVYITGRSYATGWDWATVKYNSSGAQQWAKRYNGPTSDNDEARSLALDGAGNVYVTGYRTGVWGPDTNQDVMTIKYNSAGVEVWSSVYNGAGNSYEVGNSIALDKSGNVYVAGYGSGLHGSDYVTIKYNSTGAQQWVRTYDGTGIAGDNAEFLKVDDSGNVYVTGNSWGAGTWEDATTIKYNTSGDQLWVQRYDGPGHEIEYVNGLEIDHSGNVYVTARSWGGNTVGLEFATVKYNSTGVQQWAMRYSEPGLFPDVPNAIAVDDSGNVYVAGQINPTGAGFDYATLKYDPAGTLLWIQTYNGSGNDHDRATSVVVDKFHNVYVTGHSFLTGTDFDYVTIKYNSSGVQQWLKSYNGTANIDDIAGLITIDQSGNVYVTGNSKGIGTDFDYATIKYSQAKGISLTALVQGFYNNNTGKMKSDTMRVYLRNINSPFSIADSSISILDSAGKGIFYFNNAVEGTPYFISLKHRNSIETWSRSTGQSFYNFAMVYDFSDSLSKAFAGNMVQVNTSPNKFAVFSGDVNKDGSINLTDVTLVFNAAIVNAIGYLQSDVSGDNVVNLVDLTITYNNALSFVKKITP
ncbi:MAG: SBBP repeat-containing protein [Ignavibacteria bacterium]